MEFLSHNNENLRDSHADLWLGFTEDDISSWVRESGLDVTKVDIKEHQNYKILILTISGLLLMQIIFTVFGSFFGLLYDCIVYKCDKNDRRSRPPQI